MIDTDPSSSLRVGRKLYKQEQAVIVREVRSTLAPRRDRDEAPGETSQDQNRDREVETSPTLTPSSDEAYGRTLVPLERERDLRAPEDPKTEHTQIISKTSREYSTPRVVSHRVTSQPGFTRSMIPPPEDDFNLEPADEP